MTGTFLIYTIVSFLLFCLLIPKERDATPTWKIALIALVGGPVIWLIAFLFLIGSHAYEWYKNIKQK